MDAGRCCPYPPETYGAAEDSLWLLDEPGGRPQGCPEGGGRRLFGVVDLVEQVRPRRHAPRSL